MSSNHTRRRRSLALGAFGLASMCLGCSGSEDGAPEGNTYRVGPNEEYRELRDVVARLAPGDLVEVVGGATYPGGVLFANSGEAERRITVRGIRDANGARPVLEGAEDTVHLAADHFVLEGFEITGGSFRCVYHQADDVIVRDTWVHDCAGHGILGADEGAGSLTLDGIEVSGCGQGDALHAIYAATDEVLYPSARFRLLSSYVHDNHGGNSVKSRAQRNDILYNWIEGSAFFELDLIGAEAFEEYLAREDSDIVGNVLAKTVDGGVLRAGTDGSGESFGRYRFAYNTVLLAPQAYGAPIHLAGGIESLEIHGNVFVRQGDGDDWQVIAEDDVHWTSGPAHAGKRNWVQSGAVVPADWAETLEGTDPGFVDLPASDLRPTATSPLVDGAEGAAGLPADLRIPAPLEVPSFVPPTRIAAPGGVPRAAVGAPDIGAFEAQP